MNSIVTAQGERRLAGRRYRRTRAVVAPPPNQRAALWDKAVPVSAEMRERSPLVWLLGSHGGAGVTTLARLLAPAADCYRRWPAGVGAESPYVLVVARETVSGLAAADALLRQHHAGLGGASEVLGLVTIAARPGRVPPQIRRDRDLYTGLVENRWRVEWHETFTLVRLEALPVWTPTSSNPSPRTSRDDLATVPAEVRALGQQLLAVITEREATHIENGEGR